MRKLSKVLLITGGVIVIPALLLVIALQVLDTEDYKRQLEQRASEAAGMSIALAGPLEVSLFPRLQVTLNQLQVEKEGQQIAAANRIDVGLDLWPLFHRELRVNSITLHEPSIALARLVDGTFNIQKPDPYEGTLPSLNLVSISIRNAAIMLADAITDAQYDATGCDIEVNDLALANSTRDVILRNLALDAELQCDAITREAIVMNDVNVVVTGSNGQFVLAPMTMNLFGGAGSGTFSADFSGEKPSYDLDYALPQFQTGAFLEAFFPQQTITGNTDFTARLSMQGSSSEEIRQNLSGSITLRGAGLTIHGIDLDEELAEFESTQNFTLIDIGAVFFAGPLGLAVTKGYDYASLFQRSDSNSEITKLVSDWTVTNGLAQSQDVAMTTSENLIAVDGALDLANSRFDDLTVALLDARGCVSVQQVIRGPFQEPEIDKPGFLMALAAPALSLLKQGVEMLPGEECEPFYQGTLAPR